MNPICSTIDCGNNALPGYTMCADCAGQYEYDRARIGRRMGVPCTTTSYMTPTCPVPALTSFTRASAPVDAPNDGKMEIYHCVMVDPDTMLPAPPVPQEDTPAPLPFYLTRRALCMAIAFAVLMIALLFAVMPGNEDYAAVVQLVGTICLACALGLYASEWEAGRWRRLYGVPESEDEE